VPTVALRVREGVYDALKELAEATNLDISAAATIVLAMTLADDEFKKLLSKEVKEQLEADFMDALGDFLKMLAATGRGKKPTQAEVIQLFTGKE